MCQRKIWKNLMPDIWKEEKSQDFGPGWNHSQNEGMREKSYVGGIEVTFWRCWFWDDGEVCK